MSKKSIRVCFVFQPGIFKLCNVYAPKTICINLFYFSSQRNDGANWGDVNEDIVKVVYIYIEFIKTKLRLYYVSISV